MGKSAFDRQDTLVMPFDLIKDKNRLRKVVFYGRVSTEHEAQLSAMENQKEWYWDQAKHHVNWDIVSEYFDEGITGTQAKKRPAFLEMVEDAKKGKFDLIVTREVCRFARNTVDTLVTTRMLKGIGVEVYFIEDNIWTMDGDGELRLTLMATLAQEESRKVSERVKAGQHISRENGTVYGNGNIMGYDREVGETYTINEEQAATVRLIYKMYLEERLGMTKIANILNAKGLPTASGTCKWTQSNVGRILRNPTYMGVQAYGKSFSNNYLEQKRINNHDTASYLYKKSDYPAIISEEDWYKAEAIRQRRSYEVKELRRTDPYLGEVKVYRPKLETKQLWKRLVRCGCGSSMRRETWHVNKTKGRSYGLHCYNQINNGSAQKMRKLHVSAEGHCGIKTFSEWKLDFMAKHIFTMLFTTKVNKKIIENVVDIIEQCYMEKLPEEIDKKALEREIGKIQAKISTLVDMRTEGEITKDEYRTKRDKLNEEVAGLQTRLSLIETNVSVATGGPDFDAIKKGLETVLDVKGSYINEELIDKYVSRIIVESDNKFRWIINLSGKKFEESDLDSEISIIQILPFEDAKAWRKATGDYLRCRQWQDIEVDIRII